MAALARPWHSLGTALARPRHGPSAVLTPCRPPASPLAGEPSTAPAASTAGGRCSGSWGGSGAPQGSPVGRGRWGWGLESGPGTGAGAVIQSRCWEPELLPRTAAGTRNRNWEQQLEPVRTGAGARTGTGKGAENSCVCTPGVPGPGTPWSTPVHTHARRGGSRGLPVPPTTPSCFPRHSPPTPSPTDGLGKPGTTAPTPRGAKTTQPVVGGGVRTPRPRGRAMRHRQRRGGDPLPAPLGAHRDGGQGSDPPPAPAAAVPGLPLAPSVRIRCWRSRCRRGHVPVVPARARRADPPARAGQRALFSRAGPRGPLGVRGQRSGTLGTGSAGHSQPGAPAGHRALRRGRACGQAPSGTPEPFSALTSVPRRSPGTRGRWRHVRGAGRAGPVPGGIPALAHVSGAGTRRLGATAPCPAPGAAAPVPAPCGIPRGSRVSPRPPGPALSAGASQWATLCAPPFPPCSGVSPGGQRSPQPCPGRGLCPLPWVGTGTPQHSSGAQGDRGTGQGDRGTGTGQGAGGRRRGASGVQVGSRWGAGGVQAGCR